jgi:hypothetical protein
VAAVSAAEVAVAEVEVEVEVAEVEVEVEAWESAGAVLAWVSPKEAAVSAQDWACCLESGWPAAGQSAQEYRSAAWLQVGALVVEEEAADGPQAPS